jgi:hypothetical protein
MTCSALENSSWWPTWSISRCVLMTGVDVVGLDAEAMQLLQQERALLGGGRAAGHHLGRQSAVDEDVPAIVGLDQVAAHGHEKRTVGSLDLHVPEVDQVEAGGADHREIMPDRRSWRHATAAMIEMAMAAAQAPLGTPSGAVPGDKGHQTLWPSPSRRLTRCWERCQAGMRRFW